MRFQRPHDGATALMVAADRGHAEVCRVLLNAGAEVDEVNARAPCVGSFSCDQVVKRSAAGRVEGEQYRAGEMHLVHRLSRESALQFRHTAVQVGRPR